MKNKRNNVYILLIVKHTTCIIWNKNIPHTWLASAFSHGGESFGLSEIPESLDGASSCLVFKVFVENLIENKATGTNIVTRICSVKVRQSNDYDHYYSH